MRDKLKIKKSGDFVKSLGIKNDSKILEYISKYEGKKTLTEIIKGLWDSKEFKDNEIVYAIFMMGDANAKRNISNMATKVLGNLGGTLGGLLKQNG